MQTEADYEYRSHQDDIYSHDKSWTELDPLKKKESISRIKTKCVEKNVLWGGNAAEWKLHGLHVAARVTHKNRIKAASNSTQKLFDRWLVTDFSAVESSATANETLAPPSKQGSSSYWDPVKEASSGRK